MRDISHYVVQLVWQVVATTCELMDGKHCVTFQCCHNAKAVPAQKWLLTDGPKNVQWSWFGFVFVFFCSTSTHQSHHHHPKISSVSLFFLCLAQNFLCLPPLASRLADLRSTAPSLLVQHAKNTCHVGLLWTDWQQSIERGEMRGAKRSFSVRYEIAKMYGSKSCFSFVLFCFTNNCAALLLICF